MISARRTPSGIRVTLFLVFWGTILVVAAGSIVRTTGSGLGCPDWPQCFGRWIPPTSLDQLPSDYQTRYQIAGKIIAEFDAFKTWIEYFNRLLGALLGLGLVFLSLQTWRARQKISPKLLWGAQFALLLVIVQGGLGALVVATNLHGQTITLHLGLAVLLALLLSRLRQLAGREGFFRQNYPSPGWHRWRTLVCLLAVAQLVLGTEVRKTIDHLVHDFVSLPRIEWAAHLQTNFLVHRSLALVFAASALIWYAMSRRQGLRLSGYFVGLGLLVALAVATGVALREFGFPAWAQPAHLVFGVLLLVQVDKISCASRHP